MFLFHISSHLTIYTPHKDMSEVHYIHVAMRKFLCPMSIHNSSWIERLICILTSTCHCQHGSLNIVKALRYHHFEEELCHGYTMV